MNKYTHSFYLEQHSPLIHFQHDQAGASLRASELRPRLDKQIAQNLGGWDKIPEKWLVGAGLTGHKALDYRVKITPLGARSEEDLNPSQTRAGKWNAPYPGYFANMGMERMEDATKLIWYPQVKITFTCLQPKLLDEVKKAFSQLMTYANFGTRKSKGFGSFWLIDQYLEDAVGPNTPYLFVQRGRFRDVADAIDYYYKRLKSGVNYSHDRRTGRCDGHYEKSFLYKYLEANTDYFWEKRWLKEQFFGLTPKAQKKKYARAMLGMAGSVTFRQTDEPCNPHPDKTIIGRGEAKDIEISHASTKEEEKLGQVIARIPSPIIFKPIRCGADAYKVFILIDPMHQLKQITGKKFKFKARREEHTLETPDKLINYRDLIQSYHNELGDAFDAVLFNGRKTPITIHHT